VLGGDESIGPDNRTFFDVDQGWRLLTTGPKPQHLLGVVASAISQVFAELVIAGVAAQPWLNAARLVVKALSFNQAIVQTDRDRLFEFVRRSPLRVPRITSR
jgi:hypothetical protein